VMRGTFQARQWYLAPCSGNEQGCEVDEPMEGSPYLTEESKTAGKSIYRMLLKKQRGIPGRARPMRRKDF